MSLLIIFLCFIIILVVIKSSNNTATELDLLIGLGAVVLLFNVW